MATNDPVRHRSIYFDDDEQGRDRLWKLDQVVIAFQRQTGMRVTRSMVLMRAVDDLFLAMCPLEEPGGDPGSHVEPINA